MTLSLVKKKKKKSPNVAKMRFWDSLEAPAQKTLLAIKLLKNTRFLFLYIKVLSLDSSGDKTQKLNITAEYKTCSLLQEVGTYCTFKFFYPVFAFFRQDTTCWPVSCVPFFVVCAACKLIVASDHEE